MLIVSTRSMCEKKNKTTYQDHDKSSNALGIIYSLSKRKKEKERKNEKKQNKNRSLLLAIGKL